MADAPTPLRPHATPPAPKSAAARIRDMQADAHDLALCDAVDFANHALALVEHAGEIARSEAYPVGVRDIARRWAVGMPTEVRAMLALLQREERR